MKQTWERITLQELRQHDACEGGVKMYHAWKRAMGRGRKPLRILWSPLAMVLGLSHPDERTRGYVRWLIGMGLLPMWSLRNANLRYANLRGANLEGADLRGANLNGANLICAYLSYANLRGADLSYANLRGADLNGANLYGANLTRANLEGANLNGANLNGAYYPVGDVPEGWTRGEDGYLKPA